MVGSGCDFRVIASQFLEELDDLGRLVLSKDRVFECDLGSQIDKHARAPLGRQDAQTDIDCQQGEHALQQIVRRRIDRWVRYAPVSPSASKRPDCESRTGIDAGGRPAREGAIQTKARSAAKKTAGIAARCFREARAN